MPEKALWKKNKETVGQRPSFRWRLDCMQDPARGQFLVEVESGKTHARCWAKPQPCYSHHPDNVGSENCTVTCVQTFPDESLTMPVSLNHGHCISQTREQITWRTLETQAVVSSMIRMRSCTCVLSNLVRKRVFSQKKRDCAHKGRVCTISFTKKNWFNLLTSSFRMFSTSSLNYQCRNSANLLLHQNSAHMRE